MIYNIQALRAIAAVLVIFVHLAAVLAPLGVHQSDLAFGEVGVDLFFVISGFVMVHMIQRAPVSAGSFLLNRVVRVAPLYWLLTLAVFGIALVVPSLLGATRAVPAELVKSLLFVPFAKSNGLVSPVLFVGWTLNYEMFFYALFAAALLLTGSAVVRTVWLTAALLIALTAFGAVAAPHGVIAHFFTAPLMLEFCLGMILGLIDRPASFLNGSRATALVVVGLILLVGLPLATHSIPRLFASGGPAMLTVWAALAAERSGRAARSPFVQLLGGASYALYLVHPFPLQAAGKMSQRLNSIPLALVAALIGVALALVLAIIVHRAIELPMTRTLRRVFGLGRSVVERHEPSLDDAIRSV